MIGARLWAWLNGHPEARILTRETVTANLVRAIEDYFAVTAGGDARKATRAQRRILAKELSDLILEHIAVKRQ